MSNKLSKTESMFSRRYLRALIETQAHPEFRKHRQSMDITDTDRTYNEQYALYKSGKSQTLDSYHLIGLAADATVSKKEKGIVRFYDWNKSEKYEIYANKCVDNGLRSLGLTHDWDWYHIEYPVIFQGSKPYCFAYVILNALQGVKREWRIKSKAECYKVAEKLYKELLDRRMPRHVESACIIAKEWGLIDSFESLEYRDIPKMNDNVRQTMQALLDRNKGIVISQSGRPYGTNDKNKRAKIRRERLKTGRGIFQHTMVVSHVDKEGIHLVNSHKTNPQVTIKWEFADKGIQRIHVLS